MRVQRCTTATKVNTNTRKTKEKKRGRMQDTIILFPAPGMGHVISMVELGKLILHHYSNNFTITILLTTDSFWNTPSVTSYIQGRSQRGARGGTCPLWLLKYPCICSPLVTPWHWEKKKKIKKDTHLKVTQEKERKEKLFSKNKPCNLFTISLFS